MMTTANGVAAHAACANGSSSTAMNHDGGAAGSAAALQLLQEFLQVQGRRAEVYSRFSQGFRELLDNGQEASFARLMHEVTPLFNAASQQVIQIEAQLKSAAVNRPDLAALLRGVQEQERNKLKLTLSWQALRAAHAAGRFSWQDATDRPRTQGASAAGPSQQPRQQQQQQQQQLMALLEQRQMQTAQAPAGAAGGAAAGCDVRAGASDQCGGRGTGAAAVKPGFYEQQMQQAVADALAAADKEHHQQQQGGVAGSGHGCGAAASHAHAHAQHTCGHGHDHTPASDPLVTNNPLEPNEAEYTAAVRETLQELDGCVGSINELLEEVREAVLELELEQ